MVAQNIKPVTMPEVGQNGSCVGLIRGERMLVVRTHRYLHCWQPVGGEVEQGETFVDAACREVFEETGWVIHPHELTSMLELPMDSHEGTIMFFTANAPDTDLIIDDSELAEVRWVTREDIGSLPGFAAAQQFHALWSQTS